MKQVCDGAPPSRKVMWVIETKSGQTMQGYGQTAFVAAADAGLLLSDVRKMWQHGSEET